MPRIEGTTNAQTKFLRTFRNSPSGPAKEDWPSPAILRRWMRKPGFIRAMESLRTALVFQSDFQLLSVAASASLVLHAAVTSASDDGPQANQLQTLGGLLKLAHVRERFTSSASQRDVEEEEPLPRLIHPSVSDEEAAEHFRAMRESRRNYEAWQQQRALEKESGESGI